MTKDQALDLIIKWKSFWMNQTQNSPKDHKNYFSRAIGVDANMKHHLANMIAEATECEIERIKDQNKLLNFEGNKIDRDVLRSRLKFVGIDQDLIDKNPGEILEALIWHCENRDEWIKQNHRLKKALDRLRYQRDMWADYGGGLETGKMIDAEDAEIQSILEGK